MSQHLSSDFVISSSSSDSREKESMQMINLSDLVLDAVPVSTVYPVLSKEEGSTMNKDNKVSSKFPGSKTTVEQKTRVSSSDKNSPRKKVHSMASLYEK